MSDSEPRVRALLDASIASLRANPRGALLMSLLPTLAGLAGLVLLVALTLAGTMGALYGAELLEEEILTTVAPLLAGIGLALLAVPVVALTGLGPLRALHAHRMRGVPLGFSSCLSFVGSDVLRSVGVVVVVRALVELGVYALLLPGVALQGALAFPVVAVVVHGAPIGRALRLGWRFFLARPRWALSLGLALVGIQVLANTVPVLGHMIGLYLASDLMVRAYSAWFSGGAEPAARFAGIGGEAAGDAR